MTPKKSKIVICENCGLLHCKKPFELSRVKHYFCSMECSQLASIGRISSKKGKKLLPLSKSHRKKISIALKGKRYNRIAPAWNKGKTCPQFANGNNGCWKGNKVSYSGLHRWVKRKLGAPLECQFCGKEWNKSQSIQWANKSGKYLRSLNDWLSLCVKCHKKYDLKLKAEKPEEKKKDES